jgi:hypothetical protein
MKFKKNHMVMGFTNMQAHDNARAVFVVKT